MSKSNTETTPATQAASVAPDGTQIAPEGAMDKLAAKPEPQKHTPKPPGQYMGKWGKPKGQARTAEEIANDLTRRGKPRSQVEDLITTQPGDKLGLPAIPAPVGASGKAAAAAPSAEKPAPKPRKAKATKGVEEAPAAESNGNSTASASTTPKTTAKGRLPLDDARKAVLVALKGGKQNRNHLKVVAPYGDYTGLMRGLEEDGLVQTIKEEGDKMVHYVLTKEGRKALPKE
jgi:hypothetical protein